MERKFRKYMRKVARKMAKYLPDIFRNSDELDEQGRKLFEECLVLTDDALELAAEQYAQLDRIEEKLDYIIGKIG